jgi:hypothetical protein
METNFSYDLTYGRGTGDKVFVSSQIEQIRLERNQVILPLCRGILIHKMG